jgi:hypothetical protein
LYLHELVKADEAVIGKNLIDGDGLDLPFAYERERHRGVRTRTILFWKAARKRPGSQLLVWPSQLLSDSAGQGLGSTG